MPELRFAPPLPSETFADIRRQAIFHCCKWDPQTQDQSTLSPMPLVLSKTAAHYLASAAELLSQQTLIAELELIDRPELYRQLGLGFGLRRLLSRSRRPRALARIMRFDFHLTTEGWLISEVNSDVPGGLIEAGGFTRMLAIHYPDLRCLPEPAAMLADACAERLGKDHMIALVHATAYSDDRQVMTYLVPFLERRGLQTCLIAPDHLRWKNDQATIDCEWHHGPADGIIRFFPAEWLPNLPRKFKWRGSADGTGTPQCNPVTAMLTQSKRFALVLDQLRAPIDLWKRFLPETRDPRKIDRNDPDWILKPAHGRVGEGIAMTGTSEPRIIREALKWSRWFPSKWIAQRRFTSVPIDSPDGPRHACLGIFTVNGRFAGIYGRISHQPLIDDRAQDAAVLVEQE